MKCYTRLKRILEYLRPSEVMTDDELYELANLDIDDTGLVKHFITNVSLD